MTHASLFSGIGGFDIAAEWAGWDNVFIKNNIPEKEVKHDKIEVIGNIHDNLK